MANSLASAMFKRLLFESPLQWESARVYAKLVDGLDVPYSPPADINDPYIDGTTITYTAGWFVWLTLTKEFDPTTGRLWFCVDKSLEFSPVTMYAANYYTVEFILHWRPEARGCNIFTLDLGHAVASNITGSSFYVPITNGRLFYI